MRSRWSLFRIAWRHPSSAPGSNASNDPLQASTPTPPAIVAVVGDSAVVARSLGKFSDTRHGGQADCNIISTTSKDEGADTPNDLQEVSVPDSDEVFDKDGRSLAPKKKPRKKL